MAIQRQIVIVCDSCDTDIECDALTVNGARLEAKGTGWATRLIEGRHVDLCDECSVYYTNFPAEIKAQIKEMKNLNDLSFDEDDDY